MSKSKGKKIFGLFVVALLLLPLWMWLAWLLTPRRRLTAAIVDKTVLDRRGQEHISLDWVLNQQRFTKTSSSSYEPARDYFGFFPGRDDRYSLKGLERFSPAQLQRLASDADLVYFTDTYGVYWQEWLQKADTGRRSGLLYGGMSKEDIGLLKEMKARHKLMMAEFNSIGSPTREDIRKEFENLFGMRWTGWTARYFTSLDTLKDRELPRWLILQYRQQHQGAWPFHNDGIAWVDDAGQIVITEASTHLVNSLPHIVPTAEGIRELGLPADTKYPFWFDVIDPGSPAANGSPAAGNRSAADFVIDVNARGAALLKEYHIPTRFPAVLRHLGSDYRFYYFSGDFCDNPLTMTSSYFKGIGMFKSFFYDEQEPGQRKSFFWNFYRPLMTRILEEEYHRLHQ